MGLDTQLIQDGTYFIVEVDGRLAGCGGWSPRATMYGGDQTPGRNAEFLKPKSDPAKVRAMYTHPAYARKGVGRLILSLCESAASKEGFLEVELMATMSGEPLYRACGYEPVQRIEDRRGESLGRAQGSTGERDHQVPGAFLEQPGLRTHVWSS